MKKSSQSKKKKSALSLRGIVTVLLVVGAVIGLLLISSRVSGRLAVAPTAPESEPQAAYKKITAKPTKTPPKPVKDTPAPKPPKDEPTPVLTKVVDKPVTTPTKILVDKTCGGVVCANGYNCINEICQGNTDVWECGRNTDTGAPVCCTDPSCLNGDKVCEPPGRLECLDNGKYCLIKANSPDCGGSATPTETPIVIPTATPTKPPVLVCETMRAYKNNEDVTNILNTIKKNDVVVFKGYAPNTQKVISMTFQVTIDRRVILKQDVPVEMLGSRWVASFPYTFSGYGSHVVKVISINK
ncbi:MAG: hypothetical protein UW68_C0029G0009 [Candidatus Collierbacteria bacterium GW2011_GWB1_44_6]|uniref:Uncharacterized protein n=2 Tax=Candidatus Collieribacteriota TaxID=1752725 RepID=A0A0G1JMR9_9BACT|nr:MAG: hypothetical protein UV68_C0007G0006 [Candidatus Collierbacteria bacterium GW2011_GWC2_43_12]KKT72668.1 MAG: hypothetical protein UW68_C0029G0009 [Candidatus Collierbacteria bacterium GW2011_GWB1_44_6]